LIGIKKGIQPVKGSSAVIFKDFLKGLWRTTGKRKTSMENDRYSGYVYVVILMQISIFKSFLTVVRHWGFALRLRKGDLPLLAI